MDDQAEFYRLSALAIKAGMLTAAERDLIARAGHRKAPYWARHLRDLREILIERARRPGLPEEPWINCLKSPAAPVAGPPPSSTPRSVTIVGRLRAVLSSISRAPEGETTSPEH